MPATRAGRRIRPYMERQKVSAFWQRRMRYRSLRELITYGLKGLSAYSKHANVLLADDVELDAFLQRALATQQMTDISVNHLGMALENEQYGVKGMALLDGANTPAYSNRKSKSTSAWVSARASLVSGHDLRDLEMAGQTRTAA